MPIGGRKIKKLIALEGGKHIMKEENRGKSSEVGTSCSISVRKRNNIKKSLSDFYDAARQGYRALMDAPLDFCRRCEFEYLCHEATKVVNKATNTDDRELVMLAWCLYEVFMSAKMFVRSHEMFNQICRS